MCAGTVGLLCQSKELFDLIMKSGISYRLPRADRRWRNTSEMPASTRARRHAASHGPYFGAGVWLKSRSSVTQVKFAAMLVLPLPLYFATLGKTQSGRVI